MHRRRSEFGRILSVKEIVSVGDLEHDRHHASQDETRSGGAEKVECRIRSSRRNEGGETGRLAPEFEKEHRRKDDPSKQGCTLQKVFRDAEGCLRRFSGRWGILGGKGFSSLRFQAMEVSSIEKNDKSQSEQCRGEGGNLPGGSRKDEKASLQCE